MLFTASALMIAALLTMVSWGMVLPAVIIGVIFFGIIFVEC